MRVAFLYDPGNADGTIGGAELTMREFIAKAPEGVETIDARGDATREEIADAEAVVVGNCTSLDPLTALPALRGKKVTRYHNDLAFHESRELREWLEQSATHIFTSPLHQRHYGQHGVWPNIPPAIDLDSFRPSRQIRRNGKREGTCSIAAWQNPGKGGHLLAEFAEQNGPVDVYGNGQFTPRGPNLNAAGALEPEQVPQTLWRYERFVFLPSAIEPFGRCVIEAYTAGCQVITNGQVGARHYIENDLEALETAAQCFWEVACA